MKIEENISLSKYTSFHIGGQAKYFCVVKKIEDLREAINFAKEKKINFLALGSGSNVLIKDSGFSGLVIKNEIKGISFDKHCCKKTKITVGAGENWDDFVKEAVSRELYGVETMSGIPGTIGAAVVGNIGAYGNEVKDVIFSVEAFDPETETIRIFSKRECFFGYRDSIFKSLSHKKFIIISASFLLKNEGVANILYKDLEQYFKDNNTPVILESVREAILKIREEKLPHWQSGKMGTAGSFWKNIIMGKNEYEELKKRFPDIPAFSSADQGAEEKAGTDIVKIPLAFILDKICNLKGFRKGNVGLWDKQPLVLVNYGDATAKEVGNFADEIAEKVFSKTGIKIEREVESIE